MHLLSVLIAFATAVSFVDGAEPLRVGTFSVDVTPPLGSPQAYRAADRILDPLYARGVVILSHEQPIVLCAVDWIGIGNGGYDAWREALALAADTTVDRVAVHCLHQHDAPRFDLTAEKLLEDVGLGGRMFDMAFAQRAIAATAAAVEQAGETAAPVTHIGLGRAKVDQVASNRRILGPDGKVQFVRYSSCRDPRIIAAPEGTIDPWLRTVSFWNGDDPLAAMTYYATHPQSYYQQGDVSADFVGLARAKRDDQQPDVAHVHFNGASGNVAAGKYNDGSKEMRPILTERLADGMRRSWEATAMTPVSADDVDWRVVRVALPLRDTLREEELRAKLANPDAPYDQRRDAALDLAHVLRTKAGQTVDVSRLRIGPAHILHMPGELFVEYQLAAQNERPDDFVCMAAYGEYGPGYIGVEIAYSQGGYETGAASRTAPDVEGVLMDAIRALLK